MWAQGARRVHTRVKHHAWHRQAVNKQRRSLRSKNFPGPCFGFSKDKMSTFLGTEGRPDSLTCQHLEWKTRSSSTRDEVLITPHIPACINTAEQSKKSTLLTRRAFPGVKRSLLCPGSRVSSPVGSNLLLLGLQGFTEEPQPRRHFSAEEKSSTPRGDGGVTPRDAARGGSIGTERFPKHRRMLRDAADISPDLSLPGSASGKAEGGRAVMPCFMARVKRPHLHQQPPGAHQVRQAKRCYPRKMQQICLKQILSSQPRISAPQRCAFCFLAVGNPLFKASTLTLDNLPSLGWLQALGRQPLPKTHGK